MNNIIAYNSVYYFDREFSEIYPQLSHMNDVRLFGGLFYLYARNMSINDRTETIQIPLKTTVLDYCRLPKFEVKDIDFELICNNRARLLMDQAKQGNRKIAIMWSGGVDSTLIATSLLKTCTFCCLHTQREEHHHCNGSTERGRIGKNKHKCSLPCKTQGMDPDSSAHADSGISLIRQVSAQTTSKQVHPSKNGSDGGGRLRGEIKLILEVESGSIIHRQLDTKAGGVMDKHDPRVDVESSSTERCSRGNLWHLTMLLQLAIVALGCILGNKVDQDTDRKGHGCGYNANSSPRLLCIAIIKYLLN